ncbi:MAG: cysteine--tRNA ligase [Candidatus Omnitrophota bacterium]
MKIYNTLTRGKEEFIPLEKNKVKMYVCGPTVYDVPHIGHARSAYIFDMIRRHFEHKGLEVYFVRNVTDIDDKIIKKAKEELAEIEEGVSRVLLKESVKEVAVRYLRLYHCQMELLGIQAPDCEPKATENIPEMIEFIQVLIDKGYAYVSGASVYFSVEKFKAYGKLSGQKKDEMIHGARVEVDEKKQYALDFILWKEAKPEEPLWQSPWGMGRPGWHIECSVMSTRILGPRFDIHGGGLDLIFPHHENEIAQAEAATGESFANYWIHNGLVTVQGEKMSKSLGNYVTISDFMEKYKDPDLLKIAFLTSHYRSGMDYSEDKMEEARRIKERIMIFFDKVDRLKRNPFVKAEHITPSQTFVNNLREKYDAAMDDDFNTPVALSVIFEAVKQGNEYLARSDISVDGKKHLTSAIKNYVLRFSNILGLTLKTFQLEENITREIKKLITLRQEARSKKDYKSADELRLKLTAMGVIVEDTPKGPTWRKN